MTGETIAAIATPLGTGGIGVVRISGANAIEIAGKLAKVGRYDKISDMDGYTCAYGRVFDADGAIDEAVITVFRAPRSYTGEDVVELAAHGGVYLLNRILRACYAAGAAPAAAGEFTRRAFLSGKLDLTQAEAVADLISAGGRQAAAAAYSARRGALCHRLDALCERLTAFAAHIAAWIDYPDDDIDGIDENELLAGLEQCAASLGELLDGYDTGRVIREGIDAVIVGRPNVGKSTLMNLLAGYDRSIVTELAGTTRDVVSDTVRIGEVVLRLSDTAGIRDSDDPIEQAGVRLAVEQLRGAQLVLVMFDGSQPLDENDRRVIKGCDGLPCIALINKDDLPRELDEQEIRQGFSRVVNISAKTHAGAQQLQAEVEELFRLGSFDPAAAMLANERQREGASRAHSELSEAIDALRTGVSYDAVCVCIENAIDGLLELTGKRASQEVVEQVFARFCVGK